MAIFILVALIIVNTFTVYKFLFNMIFDDTDDFNESVRYSLTPDMFSLFKGRYWKDRVGEFKLGFFIILCIIATTIEYWIINSIIQGVNYII